jgi:hypothetical protein
MNAYLVATKLNTIPQIELIIDMDQRNHTCRALEWLTCVEIPNCQNVITTSCAILEKNYKKHWNNRLPKPLISTLILMHQ